MRRRANRQKARSRAKRRHRRQIPKLFLEETAETRRWLSLSPGDRWRYVACKIDTSIIKPCKKVFHDDGGLLQTFYSRKRDMSRAICAYVYRLLSHGIDIPDRIRYLILRYSEVKSIKDLKLQGYALCTKLGGLTRQVVSAIAGKTVRSFVHVKDTMSAEKVRDDSKPTHGWRFIG